MPQYYGRLKSDKTLTDIENSEESNLVNMNTRESSQFQHRQSISNRHTYTHRHTYIPHYGRLKRDKTLTDIENSEESNLVNMSTRESSQFQHRQSISNRHTYTHRHTYIPHYGRLKSDKTLTDIENSEESNLVNMGIVPRPHFAQEV